MKIIAVRVWKIDLNLVEGSYNWSNGNKVGRIDTTIVEIETDAGLSGYGESCPLGRVYLPSFAEGVRTGIALIAPALLGQDPREFRTIYAIMDRVIKGHPYIKAPIDIACWDLLGKATGRPIFGLLGGKAQERIPLYRAISQDSPLAMTKKVTSYQEDGYKLFQLKVGANPDMDIERIHLAREELDKGSILIADANTGWKKHEAARVLDAIHELDVYVEQPCLTYNECLSIRQRTTKPFILDESIQDIHTLIQAIKDDAIDILNLKISKVGGFTKAKHLWETCMSQGIPMIIEDTWGSDIVTATVAHLAQATPPELTLCSTDFNSYVVERTAVGSPYRKNGTMKATDLPGLGIEPEFDLLNDPIIEVMQ